MSVSQRGALRELLRRVDEVRGLSTDPNREPGSGLDDATVLIRTVSELVDELERSHRRLIETNVQLVSLREVASSLVTALDAAETSRTVARYLARAFGFEHAFLLLLNRESGLLESTWTHFANERKQSAEDLTAWLRNRDFSAIRLSPESARARRMVGINWQLDWLRIVSKPVVKGEIKFAGEPDLPASAKAYVRLSNTSLADAPSAVVAEQVIDHVASFLGKSEKLAFVLEPNSIDEHDTYTVNVLVDIDGDGKVSVGDYISMQSYPVLTFGYPNEITIEVKRVE